jgi:hypothetical protein
MSERLIAEAASLGLTLRGASLSQQPQAEALTGAPCDDRDA